MSDSPLRSAAGRLLRKGLRVGGIIDAPANAGAFTIALDYPVHPKARFGYDKPSHPQLDAVLRAGQGRYADTLRSFLPYVEQLTAIPMDGANEVPGWHNDFFRGLDAVALYCLLAEWKPNLYLEVGSGNSTKFARRSIVDNGLSTTICSIDPFPRAEVDKLCDEVIRQPLEEVDLAVFDRLEAGDVLFLDGSHRCFQNSDVAVAFVELLPRLKPGVRIHIHDIFLPWDYPPQISGWWYSEHYLLAAYLLAGDAYEVILPDFYVTLEPELHHILDPLWDRLNWAATASNGTGFWMQKVR